MLPTPRNYAIWPSVIPADVVSEMTIVPNEKAFLLKEGQEYKLTVIAVNADEPDYYHVSRREILTGIACGGVLRFSFTFSGEQEHLILLECEDQKLAEFNVYSLYEDLYRLIPLKGDLHAHSFRSDGQRDPAALAGHYREQGYDFFALTDHNRYYPGGEIDETYDQVEMSLFRVFGEEVHAPRSPVHIVHVGGKSSVTDLYVHQREEYDRIVEEYKANVPDSIPAQYKERYALAQWATDRIHEAGGLAIFAHPFWRPGASRMYNVCSDFARLLLKSGMFDAYELIGGMGQPGNNLSVAMWNDLRAEGLRIPVVGSSDVHTLEKAATFPNMFTLCFAESNDNDAVISAVKNSLCVAVEATGTEYERHYRCYGSFRLVAFAQYLLNHYFPVYTRICQGEGVSMRAYAMGEADKALIELQAAQAKSYTARFFGRIPAHLPSADVLAFEEKWRAVHLNGPLTRGGTVDAPPITRKI